MKQLTFTLLVLISIGLVSCRKDRNDPNAKENDDIQIKNYIAANGITDMLRDKTDGDTTGIYYKILRQGRGTPATTDVPADTSAIKYSDVISFVYTVRTLDGKYISTDTLNLNHFYGFAGHVSGSQLTTNPPLPKGLQTAIHNLIKYKGTAARVIIPSHLAFGINGYGLGSSSNANSHIGGNQSLDYYINIASNQELYDNDVINNYKTRNSLSGYSTTAKGLQYKIVIPGTGTDVIGDESAFTATYVGSFLDGTAFDTQTTAVNFDFNNGSYIQGFLDGLKGLTSGASVSLLVPSRLAYGASGSSPAIGPNAILHFELQVATVTN